MSKGKDVQIGLAKVEAPILKLGPGLGMAFHKHTRVLRTESSIPWSQSTLFNPNQTCVFESHGNYAYQPCVKLGAFIESAYVPCVISRTLAALVAEGF
jgi:hypothetical protein